MIEYQAVLLAGGTGSRMYPLTDNGASKHFLPIANRPLIYYQIEMLERAKFKSVVILVTAVSTQPLEKFLKEYKGTLEIIPLTIPDSLGTAEAVLHAKKYIKSDFIVVSGDLILDGSNLRNVIDVHRTKDASVTILMKPLSSLSEYPDFIGLEDVSSEDNLKKLIVYSPAANTSSSISILRASLANHPNITIHNQMLDTHLYIFSHWVLDVMKDLPEPKSLRVSLLPKLLELQNDPDSFDIPKEALEDSLRTANSMSVKREIKPNNFNCYVYLAEDSIYCERVNTQKTFMSITKDVAKGITSYDPKGEKDKRGAYISSSVNLGNTTTIGAQSIVGDNSTFGTRSSVKHSVIGNNCVFGDKCKVDNSIVLDNVHVEDGVIIKNSIICSGARLLKESNIAQSTVGYNTVVDASSFVNKQILRGTPQNQ